MPAPQTIATTPANIRASAYFVLETHITCAQCQQSTRVLGLAVPGGHQCTERDAIDLGDDAMGVDGAEFTDWLFTAEQWYDIAGPAMITTVACLSDSVAAHIQTINPHFKLTGEGNARQWSNHCAQCEILIGDGHLHASANSAFSPNSHDTAASITVHYVAAPLSAYYGWCWNDHYAIKTAMFMRLQSGYISATS